VVGGDELDDFGELSLASKEGRRGDRKVGAVQRLQGREVARSELGDALGSGQILEPVFAEVSQLELDERSRRAGDEHLPAVAGSGDAGRSVDVATDVALLSVRSGAPVCKPTRTCKGPEARVSVKAEAAASAPEAVGKAKKKASP
jgi:hypothetical protein